MNRVTSKPLKILNYYLHSLFYCQSKVQLTSVLMNIPNRTILVRFGGILGQFGRAMVRILAGNIVRILKSTYPFTKLLLRLHIF